MISIENMMVDKVNNAVASLKATYPKLKVVSDYVAASETFPLISVVEADNYSHVETQDTALEDHAANVMIEINIFANDKKKKSTAKKIASVVDECMLGNLFTRMFMGQVPNIDRTIYRITMRYRAVVAPVEKDGDTIYQMYRK